MRNDRLLAFGSRRRHAQRFGRSPCAIRRCRILVLALGIGLNAMLFSVADAVVFRPFPFADADRLVIAGENLIALRSEITYRAFLRPGRTGADLRRHGRDRFVELDVAPANLRRVDDRSLPRRVGALLRPDGRLFVARLNVSPRGRSARVGAHDSCAVSRFLAAAVRRR